MPKFIQTILEPQDWVELRAIKPDKAQKLWSKAGEIQKLIGKLQSLNRDGFNIYFGPNPRKGYGLSGDESVDLCRCLFVDFDNLTLAEGMSLSDTALAKIADAGLPKSTATILSGHGVHCYWWLLSPLEPGFWGDTQKRLNATIQSDPAIQNAERLMRLPGFLNTKSEPYVKCEVVYVEPDSKYDIDVFSKLLVELKPEPAPTPAKSAERPGQMEHKGRALMYASRWEGIAEGQGRNNAAYKHTCQLIRDFDLPESEAWEILSDWNRSNNPPLSDVELRQAFNSADKYGKRPVGTKLNESRRPVSKSEPQKDPLDDMDDYIDGVGSGRLRTIDWPWYILSDGTQALQPGTLTIISGGPGAAKSLFTMQAILYWLSNGEAIRYYGMEGIRAKYMMRCLAQLAGKSDLTKTSYVKENFHEVKRIREIHEVELLCFSKCLRVSGDMPADYLDQISAWIHEQAKQGIRIIAVDPITLALRNGKAWIADQRFVRELMSIAKEYLCNVIIVSHPEKGVDDPSLQNLAGGASYSRFSDNVFTIKKHEDKEGKVITQAGRCQVQYNQTITIAKAREGSLVGSRLAYEFDGESLTTKEIGIITKGS